MATDRQIDANRQNAQLSTGPRSAEGKRRVAANALKHGLTGRQMVLPNEKPEDFDAFRSALRDDLDPRGALEEVLVGKIVADAWRLRRVPLLEAAIHARDKHDVELAGLNWDLDRIYRIADPVERRIEAARTNVDPFDEVDFDLIQKDLRRVTKRVNDPTFVVTRVLEKHGLLFEISRAARKR